MVEVLLFIVGLCIGSFCTVLIARIPQGRSPFFGRSVCPHCGKTIPFKYNIPIVSYVLLKGRCFSCGKRISPMYPMVELLGGLILPVSFRIYGVGCDMIRISILLYLLLVLSFIDARHMILPDVITIPGTVVGVILSGFSKFMSVKSSVLGLLFGFLLFYSVGFFYRKVRGLEGLGFGDVKLMSMIGSFLGIRGVIGTLVFGSFSGLIYAVFSMLKERKINLRKSVPFGPFLSIGCALFIIFF